MKNVLSVSVLMIIASISISYGQPSPIEKGLQAINSDVIKSQLGFLSSDWTEGRMAGEKGAFLSADYIAGMLKLYGVKPAGDKIQQRNDENYLSDGNVSYFQNFTLLKTIAGKEQEMRIISTDGQTIRTNNLVYNVDFILRPSDPAVETEAPVVFAGYGLINNRLKYNDFSKLDVKGKFILRISGIPLFMRKTLNQSDYENMMGETESRLRELGAVGIIDFNPRSSVVGLPENTEFTKISPSEGVARTGKPYARYSIPGEKMPFDLLKATVSARVADEILRASGIDINTYTAKADKNQAVELPELKHKSISIKTDVATTQVAVRNVIGIIEGNRSDQIIVLGAHYDHMGSGNGYIWNGADDNGSGTVGVMTIAKALMETGKKPEKTIIIALWTAEEEGLLGSRYYVRNLAYPLKDLRLNVNFDMISRYISDDKPKSVTMTYTSSCPEFKEITQNNIKNFGIDLLVDFQPSDDPPGGTDHRSFVAVDVPVMRFKPGHREEYHTPKDEMSTINWDIMEKIIRISFANIWDLANSEW